MCSSTSISSGRDLRRFFKPFLACAGQPARPASPAWPAESGEPTEPAASAVPAFTTSRPASPRDRVPE
jgi:hypothetical protein